MSVEAHYRARIAAMSAAERMARAEALFNWSRDYLARSIAAEHAGSSEKDIRWQIALRKYGADPAMKGLIEELRARDSD